MQRCAQDAAGTRRTAATSSEVRARLRSMYDVPGAVKMLWCGFEQLFFFFFWSRSLIMSLSILKPFRREGLSGRTQREGV